MNTNCEPIHLTNALYATNNTTQDRAAPMNPITIPSITNGHLINQSVAPTNFIIPTSLLLENTVNFVVFIIKKIETPTNIANNQNPTTFKPLTIDMILSTNSC